MLTAYSFTSPHNTEGVGLEVSHWWRTDGSEYYQQRYGRPSYGVKGYFGFFPASICGHRIGATAMLRTPLTRRLDLDLGIGLSSYTNPLPRSGDTNNVYISTWLVCLIDIGVDYRLSPHLSLGARLLHSSNGMTHYPNRGLNFFRVDVNYSFAPQPPNHFEPVEAPAVEDRLRFGLAFSPSIVAGRHDRQRGLFFAYDLSLNYAYRVGALLDVGATLDFWYNHSHDERMVWNRYNYPLPFYIGAMPYVEWYWGRLSLRGGIGYTLLGSELVHLPVYERLATYYHFGHSYVGVGINAHMGQIEMIEWTYGFSLPVRQR